MAGTSSICPTCGNVIEGAYCSRCAAIAADRHKRWHVGDHGGKRPERRVAQDLPPSAPRSLAEALNGTWRSMVRDVTITINTRTRTYRSRHPGKQTETLHRLRLESESGRTMRFYKDDKAIDAVVDDDGLLRLKADKMELRFVCVYEGHDLRICPGCLAKIPVSMLICNECDWCFGSAF
jgi:hypothetical protein